MKFLSNILVKAGLVVEGSTQLNSLAGVGTRMVVTNAAGVVSTQAIPVTSVFGRTGAVLAQAGDYTTAQVTESGNLYYTDARARAAISVAGSGSYNPSTGVITINGGVTSVNTLTGAVVLTTSNISEGTNLYYTDARARAAISLTTTGSSGAATYIGGVLNIPNYTLAGLGGYSGTAGQVTYWTGASAVSGSNNLFWDNANGRLGIGTNAPNGIWSGNNRALQILSPSNFSAELVLSRPAGTFSAASVTHFLSGGGFDLFGVYSGSTTSSYVIYTNNNERLRIWTNGNALFGGGNNPSDLGVRLGVVGDTLLRGSGNTSATTALTVQNSSSTNLLTVRNDGLTTIESVSTVARLSFSNLGNSIISKDTFGTNGLQLTGPNDASHSLTITSANLTSYLVGALSSLRFSGNFTATGGSTPFSYILINGTINQTNISTSITRGLYVNPTLTAAADWRSIQWDNNTGWGLYGAGTANNYLGGSLGVGVSPSYRLQIAPSATYTDINTGDGLSIYNPTLSGANLFLGINGTGTSQGALIQGRAGTTTAYQIQLQPYGGNVGIGINPSHRLDVNGNIGISGTIYAGKSGDFNLLYDWQGNIGIWVGNNTSAYNQYSNNAHFFTNKSGATSYATFDSTGARVYGKVVAGTDSSTNGSIILQDSYTNGNLTNIGTSFSSGAPVIGFGVTPSTSAMDAFVSSTTLTAYPRGAFVVSDSLKYFSTTSATAAVGSAVTLTKRLELFNTGNLVIGGGADDGTNRLQVVGNIKSTGIIRSDITQTATASSVSISLLGSNITSYAAGFSMVNLGYGLNAMYAQHEQRFGGNATFAHGNINGAGLLINKLAPTAAGTVTITQQAGKLRTMSNLHLMTQFDGNNNLTVTDMSGLHIYGHYRTSGTGTLTVSNAYYGVFLADPNEFGTGATITGSNYGFYQQGTAPFNHFGGKVIIGTTATDGTSKLRISGLPTSSAGLLTGEVWNNGGVLTIV